MKQFGQRVNDCDTVEHMSRQSLIEIFEWFRQDQCSAIFPIGCQYKARNTVCHGHVVVPRKREITTVV
jgi:hypothetical protein